MMTLTEKWKMEGLKQGYEEGLQQGLQEGLLKGKILDAQELLIETLEEKFGKVDKELENKVKSIEDLTILRTLIKKAMKYESLDEILKNI
ncbi:hypothetical protein [Sulfurihydrogenibium sp.]|uniref:hypothetical protein n=1 Tax=Sulfurihydrogenibium sp. TaxID=2053621 RepID=UPI0026137515|nr:hypothetical protein [Sulfurihydrogenibium sp.]